MFIKFLHILSELLLYPLRMSKIYFNITNIIQNFLKYDKLCQNTNKMYNNSTLYRIIVSIIWDPSPYDVWCIRISIDYMLRFVISISSGIGYIITVVWIRFGYNKRFYNVSQLSKEQFDKTLIFVSVGTLLEVLTFYTMEYFLNKILEMKMGKFWNVLLKHRPMYIGFMIIVLQHVMTDVMIAKLIISF